MINVNQITAQLAKMPDQALQKYAAMHKSDPYVLTLAVAESNRRKEIRNASQGAQGGPQPKVVDQDIAQMAAPMLPEDSGIAQLPAQNMQGMADGGIVAFEAGGEVQHFQNKGYVEDPMHPESPLAIGTAYRKWKESGQPLLPYLGIETTRKVAAPFEAPESTFTSTGDTTDVDQMAVDAATQQAASKKSETGDAVDNAAPAQRTPVGIASLGGSGNFEKTLSKYAPKADTRSMAEYLKERADYTGESPVAKQQERLEKLEGKASSDKSEALNMALMKAGLGMMSGRSQYAFENIGKGAMSGLEDYSAAMKDLKKAAAEREKMRSDLENAEYARKRGDVDAFEKYTDRAKDREATFNAHAVSALGSIEGHKISAGASLAAAQLPGAQERLFATLGGGNVVKGLEKFQAAQTDKTGASYAKLYADYSANAAKTGVDPMSPVEFAQNMQQFMGAMNGGGFNEKPTGGNVRTLPPAK